MSVARRDSHSRPSAGPGLVRIADNGRSQHAAEVRSASTDSMPLLGCPRCGLSIRPRASCLVIEYCPRCIARAGIAVRLLSSAAPWPEPNHGSSIWHSEQDPSRERFPRVRHD